MSRQMSWCDKCKENSTIIKCYTNKAGERKRAIICMNKGCGKVIDITLAEGYGESSKRHIKRAVASSVSHA